MKIVNWSIWVYFGICSFVLIQSQKKIDMLCKLVRVRASQARKMQERGWKPRWFTKEKGSEAYRYKGGYWEARERGSWDNCPDIFGHIDSEQQIE